MTKKVTATELARKTREVLDQVRMSGKAVVVESHGKPVVAMIPFDYYKRLEEWHEEQWELMFAEPDYPLMSEEEAYALSERLRQKHWDEAHGIKR